MDGRLPAHLDRPGTQSAYTAQVARLARPVHVSRQQSTDWVDLTARAGDVRAAAAAARRGALSLFLSDSR